MTITKQNAGLELRASQWLEVRDRVANFIAGAHTRMERATAVKIAEALLRDGVIDTAAVWAQIEERRVVAEQAAAERENGAV